MQRTYLQWAAQNLTLTPAKAQLLFVLSWFHALMQERRTYIPQGWSKFYEFSYGDLKAGESIINTLVEDASKGKTKDMVNWESLYGLFENAIYGGRIDGVFDMKVLRAYLEHYFSP